MKNLTSLFETPLAGTFGQTMLHSLWQGVLIVGVYLIAVRFIKSANNKTWAGLAAFGLQFLVSAFTFSILMPTETATIAESTSQTLTFNVVLNELVGSQASQSYLDIIEVNAHWLFAGWVIGFAFLFVRQMGGLFYVQFLKSTGISQLSQKSEKAIDNVLKKIEGKLPTFQAFHSNKVDTAMVLGALKPVILIPTSLVSGLSAEQLELIIAHEIAHIKRNDFLINLGQTLLENLFFYHPIFWLVSHQIRENREHACDDWAAELTGNKVLLAKTLAQIQLSTHQPSLAMAFGKKRMPMLSRIQRLLGVTPETQKVKFTALLLMLLSVCTLGFVQNEQIPESEMEEFTLISDLNIEAEAVDIDKTPIGTPETIIKKDTSDLGIGYNYDVDQEEEQHYHYDLGDRNLNITTNDYSVRIDPNKIVINGKEQPLTVAEKKKLKMHFDEMQEANKKIESVSKEINIEVKKITDLQVNAMADVDFNPQNDPSFKKSMEQIQKESQVIAKYAVAFQSDIAKLDPNASNYEAEINKLEKAFEAKVKVHEEKMENFEIDMSDFEEKMKKFEVKMEKEFEIPAKEIEIVLDKKEAIIDKHANDMEKHHEAILKMLPKEVQNNIGMDRPERPERPDRPERPERPEKLEKPEKPEKSEKPEKPAKPAKAPKAE
ncbi:M56 family metallopeptidase [uncultured Arcticibacterium sp.]|uniref:M56 family metallopeptidase n=1 Tax=uncultured Arcticibacterium sp. TaxID=2173042 RepID=UPI0030F528AC